MSEFKMHFMSTSSQNPRQPWQRMGRLIVQGSLALALWPLALQAQSLRPSSTLNLGAGAPDQGQRSADFIVAVVNSESITHQQVRTRLLQTEQQLIARGAALAPRQELYSQILDKLIAERVQIQTARESGVRVDEPAIDAAVLSIARQNQLSLEEFRQRLKAEGGDMTVLRNNLKDELLLQRVREREVEPRVRVSDADLDAFIVEQQGSSPTGDIEINLSHILIALPENASQAQIASLAAKAQRVLERARAGEDFSALAREASDAAERANGGLLGLRHIDRFPTLFVQATQDLPAGGISAVIRSDAGFHILKLNEKRQQSLSNLTIVQTRARHILLRTSPQLGESTARERLLDLRKKIAAGLDFASAARENSHDGSARDGGDLGWAVQGQFVPEFEEVMDALKPGEVSEPVISRFGVHLIQVQERRQRKMDEREQREAARAALRERKLEEAFATWAQELRSRAYIELRDLPAPGQ